jgi:hypothetical protein
MSIDSSLFRYFLDAVTDNRSGGVLNALTVAKAVAGNDKSPQEWAF